MFVLLIGTMIQGATKCLGTQHSQTHVAALQHSLLVAALDPVKIKSRSGSEQIQINR